MNAKLHIYHAQLHIGQYDTVSSCLSITPAARNLTKFNPK